jgi:hypothetical protein
MSNPISASSGEQNNNAIIVARPAALTCVSVHTDGSNNTSVTVFDSATAANNGKKLGTWFIPAASRYGGRNVPVPVRANNGIYCEIVAGAGYGGTYYVEYIDRDIKS